MAEWAERGQKCPAMVPVPVLLLTHSVLGESVAFPLPGLRFQAQRDADMPGGCSGQFFQPAHGVKMRHLQKLQHPSVVRLHVLAQLGQS